jgi:hypothetical protein
MFSLHLTNQKNSYFSYHLTITSIVTAFAISDCSPNEQTNQIDNHVRPFDSDWKFTKDSIKSAEQYVRYIRRKILLPYYLMNYFSTCIG